MRYYVTLDLTQDEPPILVDLTELPNGSLEAHVDGRPASVDVVPIKAKTLSVRVDGNVVDLSIEGAPPDLGVIAKGRRSYMRVESERQRSAAAKKTNDGGADKLVKSPMPGRIVKLLIAAGGSVEAGTPLLIMEAMKMENELKARAPGVVEAIHVKEGDTVERSAKLITLR